jgi:hypothetical protein
MLTTILINLLIILVVIAVLWLILYLFQKYVFPLDNRIVGVIVFIVAAILIIYAISGHTLLNFR